MSLLSYGRLPLREIEGSTLPTWVIASDMDQVTSNSQALLGSSHFLRLILSKDLPRGMLSSLNTSSGSQEGKERGCFSSTSVYSGDLMSRDFISRYLEFSAKHEPKQGISET